MRSLIESKRTNQLDKLDSKHLSLLVMEFKLNSNQFLSSSAHHILCRRFKPEANNDETSNL